MVLGINSREDGSRHFHPCSSGGNTLRDRSVLVRLDNVGHLGAKHDTYRVADWLLGLVKIFGRNQTSIPVSSVTVSRSSKWLLPVNFQPLARTTKLLSGVLAAVILNGQHRVRHDLGGINFGWQSGKEVVLGYNANIDDGEVDLWRHFVSHWLCRYITVLAISLSVLGSNHQLRNATDILDHIGLERRVADLNGDNGVRAGGFMCWGFLLWGIGSILVVPLDWENGASHVIGPDVSGSVAPQRDRVLWHLPVGWVPSLNFLSRHLQRFNRCLYPHKKSLLQSC